MWPDLIQTLVCLVCGIWGLGALEHGERHVAARLFATAALAFIAHGVYDASLGHRSTVTVAALALFALVMFVLAMAKGRFHAPPR